MSDLNIKNNAESSIICERKPLVHRAENSCDFILPDYMGDVKKLLRYSVTPSPCDKFESGGELTALTSLLYRVLYLDCEDVLREATFSSEHECVQKMPENCIGSTVSVSVDSLAIRLWGPRKICAKATVKVEVAFVEEKPLPMPELPLGSETLYEKINAYSTFYVDGGEREFAEQIGKLGGIGCESVEIISSSATPVVNSCEVIDGALTVSGTVGGNVLLKVVDEVVSMEKKIPFEERLPLELLSDEKPFAYAECITLDVCASVNNESEDNGAVEFYTSVVLSFSTCIRARYGMSEAHALVSEAFVPSMQCSCEYEAFEYNERACGVSERRAVSAEVAIGEEPLRQIISCDAVMTNPRWTVSGAEAEFVADITFRPLMCGNEPQDLYTEKCDINVSERVKLPEYDSACYLNTSECITDVSATFDGKAIYYTASLKLDAEVMRKRSVDAASSITAVTEGSSGTPRIFVYYPKSDETVWQVAKKYAVSPKELLEYNSAQELDVRAAAAEISGGAIVIPKIK